MTSFSWCFYDRSYSLYFLCWQTKKSSDFHNNCYCDRKCVIPNFMVCFEIRDEFNSTCAWKKNFEVIWTIEITTVILFIFTHQISEFTPRKYCSPYLIYSCLYVNWRFCYTRYKKIRDFFIYKTLYQ